MSWLLKDATVLSSAVVIPPERHLAPWSEIRRMDDEDQSVVMMKRHLVHSLFCRTPVVIAVCDPQLFVVALRSLRPNRFGGLVLKSGAIVMVPARIVSNFDLHVGDQLEIKL